MQMGAETKFLPAALSKGALGSQVLTHTAGSRAAPLVPLTLTPHHTPPTHISTEQSWAKLHPAHTQRAFCFLAYIDVNGGCIVLETRVHSSSTWQSLLHVQPFLVLQCNVTVSP